MALIHHLQRNILILTKIRNKPYITLTELIAEIEKEFTFRGISDMGLSRRTIQRDIKIIRDEFGIEIEYCRQNGGYYINDDDYRSDIDRFLDSFDILNSLNAETGSPAFIHAEKHYPLGTQHIYPLIYAIKNSLRIIISYHKFGADKESLRHLEPYAVKENHGRWYVVARTEGEKDMKTYGLDRITELIVKDKKFSKDKSVDIAEKFKYSYGIYSSEEFPIEDVILSFDARDGGYLKSLPLHHTQEIIKDQDNEFIIRLRLRITLDFIMELMARSWSVKVIEPLSLRKQVYSICKSAMERNKLE